VRKITFSAELMVSYFYLMIGLDESAGDHQPMHALGPQLILATACPARPGNLSERRVVARIGFVARIGRRAKLAPRIHFYERQTIAVRFQNICIA
jgi:hypothetical protein